GTLRGTVVDDSGRPIDDVLLTLTDSLRGVSRAVSSDRRGRFQFALLEPGEYALMVEKLGFVPHFVSSIPVRTGRYVGLDMTLEGTQSPTPPLVRQTYAGATAGVGLPGAGDYWIRQ